jgi:hypothetical protein
VVVVVVVGEVVAVGIIKVGWTVGLWRLCV